MKKLLLLFVFSLNLILLSAQEPVKYDYCEIVGTARFMSNKVNVEIDFGQGSKFFSDNRYKDESGKPVVFNSMIDAMNFMGNQGWEFVQAFAVSTGTNSGAVYHFILKKKSDLNKPALNQ